MRNKLLLLIVVVQIITLVVIKPVIKDNLKYNINIYKESNLDSIKLENYVIGVVAAEMPATFSIESLKAQAVAARTFAYKKIMDGKLNYDSLDADKGQAYLSIEDMKNNWKDEFNRNYEIVSNAVLSTKGEIITYKGKPINSYYFSLSNGKTEDSSYVFGEENYLVSVDSSWDVNNKSFQESKYIDLSEFKDKLEIKDNINIESILRNNTNHIEKIIINGKAYTGIEIRKMFNLKSTDFDLSIFDNQVEFKTRGYGHGVGMSQYGANSMAQQGKKYDEILKYYYTGVTISKI